MVADRLCDDVVTITVPVTKREKVKNLVVDSAQWIKKRDDIHRAAKDRESQLSGASISLLKIETTSKLQSKDRTGSSDPYFVVWLTEYVGGALKTAVQEQTLTPTIELKDGAFQFPLTNEALGLLRANQLIVNVEVWDYDQGTTDDFMGWSNGYLRFNTEKAGGSIVADLAVMDGATQFGSIRMHFKIDLVHMCLIDCVIPLPLLIRCCVWMYHFREQNRQAMTNHHAPNSFPAQSIPKQRRQPLSVQPCPHPV